jgi:hypothetical protein
MYRCIRDIIVSGSMCCRTQLLWNRCGREQTIVSCVRIEKYSIHLIFDAQFSF